MDIQELKKQIKEKAEERKNEFRKKFSEEDCVEVQTKTDGVRKGRIKYVSYDEDKDIVSMRVEFNDIYSIGWTSSYDYIEETELDNVKKIEFQEDTLREEICELNSEIYGNEKKIDEITREYREKIKSLKDKISEKQKTCIHKWGNFYPTGGTRKHFIGETEIEEAECEICGVTGRNC